MKKQLITIAVALLTAGALTTSCSSEDNTIDTPQTQQPAGNTITLTATLAPKGGASRDQSGTRSGFGEAQPAFGEAKGDDGGTTRAITPGTDANSKEILNVAWAANEKIALYYQTGATSYAKATATVQSVDATGTATISADLTNAIDGGTVKFVYPASLVNETGDDIDETKLLSQNGNLTGANGISTKFDAATGEGKIHLNGGTTMPTTATVTNTAGTGNVSLIDRVCICKFHFDILESAGFSGLERNFSPIIIRDGNGHTYTITSDKDDGMGGTRGFKRSDDIYIALFPVSGKTVSFYTKYSNHYLFTASNTTLTAGKFYRNLSIDMVKDNSGQGDKYRDLRDGSITANDGDIIYQRVNTSATDKTITIPDGATVTLAGVNISATGSAGIICSGNATINLEGTNIVTTSAENYPAVQVGPTDKTLTIQGSGSLTATGALEGAGIGGGKYFNCGNITINGGTITATGGDYTAGIGSGSGQVLSGELEGSCGTITINGGIINATGGYNGAGIGSGYNSKYGSIVISDGISSLTATPGIEAQAPIGKGMNDRGSGTVTVDGVANWSGAETSHLNFTQSTTYYGNDIWTLTKKP